MGTCPPKQALGWFRPAESASGVEAQIPEVDLNEYLTVTGGFFQIALNDCEIVYFFDCERWDSMGCPNPRHVME